MKLVEKALKVVANLACESTSWVGFYEPEVPEELVKSEKKEK